MHVPVEQHHAFLAVVVRTVGRDERVPLRLVRLLLLFLLPILLLVGLGNLIRLLLVNLGSVFRLLLFDLDGLGRLLLLDLDGFRSLLLNGNDRRNSRRGRFGLFNLGNVAK